MDHPSAPRRIVVTGASRGLGLGAVRLLLASGASVIGTGKDASRLGSAAAELSKLGDFHAVAADLARPVEAAAILADAVAKRWGALDALVNNAAISGTGVFESGPPADLDGVLEVNLLSPHRLIRALLPFLLKGREPRVLNVSSEAGQFKALQSGRGDPSYFLSKYSLNGLTLLWAHELRGRVAVNSMHPGWIRSDMGGPQATDDLATGGARILQALDKPFGATGKFWHGEEEMEW